MEKDAFKILCYLAAVLLYAAGIIAGLCLITRGDSAAGFGLVNLTLDAYILSNVLDVKERQGK